MISFIARFIVINVFLVLPTSLFAQAAITKAGKFPSSKVDQNQEKHSVSIKRSFANAEEEKLLEIAETSYPPEAEIKAKCDADWKKNNRSEPSGSRWWCDSFDGVFQPYAITKGAVEYYLAVTDEFRRNDFTRTRKLQMLTTSFSYTADIRHRDRLLILDKVFTDVYEVHLSIGWSQYCGPRCAMDTTGKRTVVMDRKGDVLLVSGDRKPSFVVS